ncbi:TetR/AcrR family transcriptional regulator [Myxococcota bacterium]|nr:TetR/AcrR family transcriptional regulator [Myxococcota bacterium]
MARRSGDEPPKTSKKKKTGAGPSLRVVEGSAPSATVKLGRLPVLGRGAAGHAEPTSDVVPAGRGRLGILGQEAPAVERADAARNRRAILDAARKLLAKRPIGEICMDELAKVAGVGKGTLYRRFADRASLCRALLHDDAIELQTRVLAGFDLGPGSPWLMRLDRLLDALFDFVVEHAALLSEAAAFERGPFGRMGHPAHVWQRREIAIYLDRAARAGELPATPRPEVTADLILGALDPDLVRWHLDQGRTVAELREDFRAYWRHGVLGRRRG